MSIKSLVKEKERIEEISRKLTQREWKLQQKIDKANRGIEIIDDVVWQIQSSNSGSSNLLIKVGEL